MSKTFELGTRLSMIADMVPYGGTLADIGCDHGYLSIDLINCGMVEKAVCADVNEGPLNRAEKNIAAAGLTDKIETRLTDGLSGFEPKEVSSVVIAGMGGRLIVDILKRGADVAREARALILQPQSDIDAVRSYLFENGYSFVDEAACREDDKYYFAMKVSYEDREPPENSRVQIIRERYGPVLWQKRDPVLKEYVTREWERKARLLMDERIQGERRMQLEEEVYTDGIALQHLGEASCR